MAITTLAQRKLIETLSKTKTSKAIAEQLGISIWTVRKWRQKQARNEPALSKMGRPKTGALSTYPLKLRKAIKRIRKKNEGWGVASILDELVTKKGYTYDQLPSASSVSRYLKSQGLITRLYEPHGESPKPKVTKAKSPHDLWEVDAQGAVAVKGLNYIAQINMKDSCSLKYCMSFPIQVRHARHQPSKIHYYWAFRLAFEESGLPKQIQLDKDSVFYENTSKSPYPSRIHLWLTGLGIKVNFINLPPPLKQAKVERSHQTMDKQTLQGQSFSCWKKLFQKSNYRRQRLNHALPCRSLGGRPPLKVYPQAIHSDRPFEVRYEYELFDLKKVDNLLNKYIWYRKISKDKTFSIGGQVYYIKKAKPLSQVKIRYSKRTRLFIVRNVKELLLAKITPKGLSKEEIIAYASKDLVSMKNKIKKSRDFPLKT